MNLETILNRHNLECDSRVKNFMKSNLISNLEDKLKSKLDNLTQSTGKPNSESDQNVSKMAKNLISDNNSLINRLKSEFEQMNLDFRMIQDIKESSYLLSN